MTCYSRLLPIFPALTLSPPCLALLILHFLGLIFFFSLQGFVFILSVLGSKEMGDMSCLKSKSTGGVSGRPGYRQVQDLCAFLPLPALLVVSCIVLYNAECQAKCHFHGYPFIPLPPDLESSGSVCELLWIPSNCISMQLVGSSPVLSTINFCCNSSADTKCSINVCE